MLIRTIAYCGLATSACWAGIATPGASAYLTSTTRSVPTLDQVSRIQTPGYMSAGRTFDSYVLSVTDGGPSSAPASSGSAPEITAVSAVFGVNNGGFQVDTTSFSTFDSGAAQTQFVNLLAGATSIGAGSTDSGSSFSSFSVAPADSGSSTTITSDSVTTGDPSVTAPTTMGSSSSTSDTASKFNMAALGRVAAPQVIAVGDPVPEPSTGVAAGLATGFLAWMRLRGRRQK
jgi:hypothetical protein